MFKKFYFRKVLALPSRIFFLFFGKSFIPQLQDMGIDGFQAAFGVKDRRTVREDDLKVILPFFQTGMSQKVLKAPLEDRELMRGVSTSGVVVTFPAASMSTMMTPFSGLLQKRNIS